MFSFCIICQEAPSPMHVLTCMYARNPSAFLICICKAARRCHWAAFLSGSLTGGIHSHAHPSCWKNSFPSSYMTKGLGVLLTASQRLSLTP